MNGSVYGIVSKGSGGGGGGGGGIIQVTYAQLQALILGGTVKPGSLYKITDRGDLGLYFMGLSNTTLDFENGARDMLVPLTYDTGNFGGFDWLGIWNTGLTPSAGNLAIWGGHVWENASGNLGAPIDQFTLDAEWSLVPKSIGAYKIKTLGCIYDFENDWISYCWDENGNKLGVDYAFGTSTLSLTQSATNYCDWVVDVVTGIVSVGNECYYLCNNIGFVYNNTIKGGIYNNTNTGEIYDNSNLGDIHDNSNSGEITGNSNKGEIKGNSNTGDIYDNSNSGNINDNSNGGSIQSNSNTGSVSNNTNTGGIDNNRNTGGIDNNSNNGYITFNRNNGNISNLTNVTLNVENNINNGNISTDSAGNNITDPVVNK